MTGGQASKASLKRIKEAREKTKDAEAEELKAKEVSTGEEQSGATIVTDSMLSRVVRLCDTDGFRIHDGPFYYYLQRSMCKSG